MPKIIPESVIKKNVKPKQGRKTLKIRIYQIISLNNTVHTYTL